ncbi:PucR family transcriptional regulator [Micromonospora sp. NPDC050397]|uniref:PucR family transcriptional regulator n=1 Tax=Micromonospora sp. NPDC050397 TaxID=3364279 RepID=UPI00384B9198
MLLRDALHRQRLGLTLLTGAEALERPVSRVCVTDLPDPRRYLSGGEIVLTGLVWRRDSTDSETFVAACAEAAVTAIGAADVVSGSIPDDLVEACRRHRMPLFEVPVEVSFRDIVDEVNPSLWAQRANGLATVLGRHRGLVAAMAAGARLVDLLPPAAAELGVDCWVLTPTGRLVAGTTGMAPADRGALARMFLAAGRLPLRTTVDGRPVLVSGVPGRPEHPLTAWLLACTPSDRARFAGPTRAEADADAGTPSDRAPFTRPTRAETGAGTPPDQPLLAPPTRAETGARTPPDQPLFTEPARVGAETDGGWPSTAQASGVADAAAELAGLVALERARVDEGLRIERRLADQLGAALAGSEQVDLRSRLLSCGLPPEATFLVLAVNLTGPRTPPELLVTVCAELVGAAAERFAVTDAGLPDTVLAVLAVPPEGGSAAVETIRAGVDGYDPGLGNGRLAVGVSGPATGPGALGGAAEEARHALRTALAGGERTSVVGADELASHLLLLAGVPADTRRAFQRRLLAPLLAYDRTHNANLLRTLDSFLACGGSWTRCAALLHLHVNTLRYRIGRIEQLTGRDLSRFEDRVDFFLALRLPR